MYERQEINSEIRGAGKESWGTDVRGQNRVEEST
jgi:hypothetical protein